MDEALERLRALLAIPGVLKIITVNHVCGAGFHERKDPNFKPEVCAAFEYPLTDPRHFQACNVVKIEGPDMRGHYCAFSAEGHMCIGHPSVLLSRLQEAK